MNEEERPFLTTPVDDTIAPVIPQVAAITPPPVGVPKQNAASMTLNWDGWLTSQPKDVQDRIQGSLSFVPDQAAYKKRLSSTLWMAEREGWDAYSIGENFDLAMRSFSEKRNWGEVWKSPDTFHAKILGEADKERKETISYEGIKDDTDEGRQLRAKSLLNQAYWRAAEDDEIHEDDADMAQGWATWQKEAIASGAFNPANATFAYKLYKAQYDRGRNDLKAAAEIAKKILPVLQEEGKDETLIGEGYAKAAEMLAKLPDTQEQMVLRQILILQEKDQKGKKPEDQGTLSKMGSAATRATKSMGQRYLERFQEKVIQQDFARSADRELRKDSPELQNILAEKEKSDAKSRAVYLRDTLRNLTQESLAPISKDGYFELGAITAAESFPTIGMAAAGTAMGGAAGAGVFELLQKDYAFQASRKLHREGFNPSQAEMLGEYIGAGQAALDFVSFGLLRKAPGMQEVFNFGSKLTSMIGKGVGKIPGAGSVGAAIASGGAAAGNFVARNTANVPAQFLGRFGVTTGAETVQELSQDILVEALVVEVGSWFDKTIPGTDWRKVGNDMLRAAPETLFSMMMMSAVGAGIATRNDIHNINLLVQDTQAMELLGIDPASIQNIQRGGDPFTELKRAIANSYSGVIKPETVADVGSKKIASRDLLKQAWKDRKATEEGDSASRGIGASYAWAQETLAKKAEIAARVAPVEETETGFTVTAPDGTTVDVETEEEATAASVQAFEEQVLAPVVEEEEKKEAKDDGRPDITALDQEETTPGDGSLTRDEESELDAVAGVERTREDDGWALRPTGEAGPEGNETIKAGMGAEGLVAANDMRDQLAIQNLREQREELEKAAAAQAASEGLVGDSNDLSNPANINALLTKIRDLLQIPTQNGGMEAVVLSSGQDLEILSPIVPLVPIDVMNVLSRNESPSQLSLSDKAVLEAYISSNPDLGITLGAVGALKGLEVIPASLGAESTSGPRLAEGGITEGAVNDHGSNKTSTATESKGNEIPEAEIMSPEEADNTAEPKLWAAKNAQTDQQRKRLGLKPRMAVMRESWGTVWDLAMQNIEDADKSGRHLASEILADFRASSRALSDMEVAVLTHELIVRETAYENLKAQMAEAATDTARNELASKIVEFQRDTDELFNAVQETGTRTARALAIRKMMINDRWEIVRMRSDLVAANGGKPLTKAQGEAVTEAKKKIDEVREKEEAKEEEILNGQVKGMIASMMGALKEAMAGATRKQASTSLKKLAAESKKRIADRNKGRVSSSTRSRTASKGEVHPTDAESKAAQKQLASQAPEILKNVRVITDFTELDEGKYHPSDWSLISDGLSEGFYNKSNGETIVILNNVVPRKGETAQQAVTRVILHERLSHAGLDLLREDATFKAAWDTIIKEIPESELDTVRKLYPELDRNELAEEWFARQAEKAALASPDSVLGKLWAALKELVARLYGKAMGKDQLNQAVKEVLEMTRMALREKDFEGKKDGVSFARKDDTGTGIFDPQYYTDYVTVMANDMTKGTILNAQVYVKAMFGEDITPEQAQQLQTDAAAMVEATGVNTPEEKKKSAARAKGKAKAEQDIEAKDGEGLPSKKLIYDAAQAKVVQGMTDADLIMKAVHADMVESWPELTERQVKEIFCDYGNAVFPDQNEIKRTMRELRTLVRQIVHLERMVDQSLPEDERHPKKTGPQRDKPTQQIREMQKRVAEMKKKLGMNKKTDAQIASALDAAKTRLRNEIEDLDKFISKGGRTDAEKAPKEGLKYDDEATALVKKRDELKEALEKLEGPKVLTFDQIVANTLKALEKTEELLTRKVETGDVAVKKKQGAPVLTPEIEEKLSYIQTLRESIQESRAALEGDGKELAKEKSAAAAYMRSRDEYNRRVAAGEIMPADKGKRQSAMSKETAAAYDEMQKAKEKYMDLRKSRQAEIDLVNDKKNARKRIEKLEDRIKNKDYVQKTKRQKDEDNELLELRLQEWRTKKDWLEGVYAAKQADLNRVQRFGNSVANYLGWARAWMTGLDLSALGRQAGFMLLSRPIRTLKAVPVMLKAARSEAYAVAKEAALYDPAQNPNAAFYRRDKLNLTSPFAQSLEKLEEEYRSAFLTNPPTWAKMLMRVPVVGHLFRAGQAGVRGSARAYTTVLNEIRTQAYDAMSATLTATGKPTEVEGKLIADVINTWTGRGKIPGMKKSEEVLTAMNTLFFAPRYVASRFQAVFLPFHLLFREINSRFGNPIKFKDDAELAPIRRMLAVEYLRFAGGVAALWTAYTMFKGKDDEDDKIELDPRSSSFLKMKFGRTFVDPLAGLGQIVTLTSRLLTGQGKNPQGQISDRNAWSVIQYFSETKLSPIAGAVRNLAAGQDLRGEETSLLGELGRLMTPMSLRDILETAQTQNYGLGTIPIVVAALSGWSVQNYQDDQMEAIPDEDYNWLYSQAVAIPKVTLKQNIETIAGIDAKYDESLKKDITSDQRKKLMELTLPEVKTAIQSLRKDFESAPKDRDAWLEFRDGKQKEFNRTIRNIRETHIWRAIK